VEVIYLVLGLKATDSISVEMHLKAKIASIMHNIQVIEGHARALK
jgi:hypothetical protein